MTIRSSLVQINGDIQELPIGDILKGIGVGNIPVVSEISFLASKYEDVFTISDTNISATTSVLINFLGNPATSKDGDENEFDKMEAVAIPFNGGFTLTVQANPGPVYGAFKFSYTVA
jgi:hypothetical protein